MKFVGVGSRSLGRAALAVALLAVPLAAQARAVECGDVVGPNERVVLDHDLNCEGPGTALTVIGPATVDLNHAHVRCLGGPSVAQQGILVTGRRARIVNGLVVQGCDTGLDLAGDGGHYAQVDFVVNGTTGVRIRSDRNVVEDTVTGDHVYRGFVIYGSRNHVRRGGAQGSRTGFQIDGQRTRLTGTFSVQNEQYGYEVEAHRATLRDNLASENGRDGFRLGKGQSHVLVNNESLDNAAGHGFMVISSAGARLQGNRAEGNGFAGIWVGSSGHRMIRNRSVANDVQGLGYADLEDTGAGCGTNKWLSNVFVTANAACIR